MQGQPLCDRLCGSRTDAPPHLLDAGLEPREETPLDPAPGRIRAEELRLPEACLGESARRTCRPRLNPPPPPLPSIPAPTNRWPRPSPHLELPFADGLRPLLVPPPPPPPMPLLCCWRLGGKGGGGGGGGRRRRSAPFVNSYRTAPT